MSELRPDQQHDQGRRQRDGVGDLVDCWRVVHGLSDGSWKRLRSGMDTLCGQAFPDQADAETDQQCVEGFSRRNPDANGCSQFDISGSGPVDQPQGDQNGKRKRGPFQSTQDRPDTDGACRSQVKGNSGGKAGQGQPVGDSPTSNIGDGRDRSEDDCDTQFGLHGKRLPR